MAFKVRLIDRGVPPVNDPRLFSGGGGTVTSITASGGVTATPSPITMTGDISLSTVPDNSIIANISGPGLPPDTPITLGMPGDLLYHDPVSGDLAALNAGAPGTFLMAGAGGALSWVVPAGGGTVTSVGAAAGGGLALSGLVPPGPTITMIGDIGLAPVADNTFLGNTAGAGVVPVPIAVPSTTLVGNDGGAGGLGTISMATEGDLLTNVAGTLAPVSVPGGAAMGDVLTLTSVGAPWTFSWVTPTGVPLDAAWITGSTTQALTIGGYIAGNIRTLDTTVSDPGGIITSVVGNVVTVAAGRYIILASAPGYRVDSHQIRLFDVTGGATVAEGTVEFSGSGLGPGGSRSQCRSFVKAQVEPAVATGYRIDHRVTTTQGAGVGGGGIIAPFATNYYAEMYIIKI